MSGDGTGREEKDFAGISKEGWSLDIFCTQGNQRDLRLFVAQRERVTIQERKVTSIGTAQVNGVGRWTQSQGQRRRALAFERKQNKWFLKEKEERRKGQKKTAEGDSILAS